MPCLLGACRPCHYRATSISFERSPSGTHGQRLGVRDLAGSLSRLVAGSLGLHFKQEVGWSRLVSALPCPAGRSIPGRAGPERCRRPRPDGTGAGLRVALVRAGSVRHREPLVLGGHEQSRPVDENRRSAHLHVQVLGKHSTATAGSSPPPPAQRSQAVTRWVHAEPKDTGAQRARAVKTGTQESQASDLKRFAPSDDMTGVVPAAWRHETNRLPPQRPRSA
jgi:hypothetical protein